MAASETRFETIHVERDGELRGLVTIVLDRPESLNAISRQMHEDLQAACAVLRDDAAARVVILTGAGRAFSAGADLKQPPAEPPHSDGEARIRASQGNRTCEALEALPQVTIGAVNGLAVGGAVVFLACLDLRLAARSAWFSIPEVDLDIPLTWNALPRLMREIGPARTKELVMTCDRFDAEQAERWGFVNHLVEDEQLLPRARELASTLLAKDELSIARTLSATRAIAEAMAPTFVTHADPDYLMRGRLRQEG
jgi:enoyl-CoA hydratase/carnithine racemase